MVKCTDTVIGHIYIHISQQVMNNSTEHFDCIHGTFRVVKCTDTVLGHTHTHTYIYLYIYLSIYISQQVMDNSTEHFDVRERSDH